MRLRVREKKPLSALIMARDASSNLTDKQEWQAKKDGVPIQRDGDSESIQFYIDHSKGEPGRFTIPAADWVRIFGGTG